jgi:hypothetical protein
LNIKKTSRNILLILGIVLGFPNAFSVQNFPQKANSKSTETVIDRLTLALIDRLPTDSEREFSRLHGSKGPAELANHLIRSREFFDRQSQYWNLQLRQSPAWLWENPTAQQWDRFFNAESTMFTGKIFYFPPHGEQKGETVCSGVWSIYQNDQPAVCSCDDTVNTIPFWDTSSSMRVCPVAVKPENCGPALANCIPVDARIQRQAPTLEVDNDSAGGRAVTRLISDLTLAQGRSVALAVISNQKWSNIIETPRTVISKSSIDLLKVWLKTNPTDQIARIAAHIRLNDTRQSAKSVLLPAITNQRQRRTNQSALESQAEELYVSPPLTEGFVKQPFKPSRLQEGIWDWNIHLLMTCQIPHLAPQVFNLPLPHPDSAKEGSYFCSGCHLTLNNFNTGLKKITQSDANSVSPTRHPNPANEQVRECAVDHALQFLTGYKPNGNELTALRKKGISSYTLNQESLASVIRDIALQMAHSGDKP